MWQLVPRETWFLDAFEHQSAHLVHAAACLRDLVDDFSDVPARVRTIKAIEHAGDQVTHEIVARLHATFVTPIDRHDIHTLTIRLDDVLDYVDAAASALDIFRVKQPTAQCRALTQVAVDCVGAIDSAVKCLRALDVAFFRYAVLCTSMSTTPIGSYAKASRHCSRLAQALHRLDQA